MEYLTKDRSRANLAVRTGQILGGLELELWADLYRTRTVTYRVPQTFNYKAGFSKGGSLVTFKCDLEDFPLTELTASSLHRLALIIRGTCNTETSVTE